MNKLKLPPKPPDCPYFSNLCPSIFSIHVYGGIQFERDCNKSMDIYERNIIASVARCAWLSEEDRLRGLMYDRTTVASVYDISTEIKLGEDAKKARENSELWRIWGEFVEEEVNDEE